MSVTSYDELEQGEEKVKNLVGEKVSGYVCLDKDNDIKEQLNQETVYVYVQPYDSLSLLTKENPGIFKVEGTSTFEKERWNESNDRAYYECKDVKKIRELSREEIINMVLKDTNSPEAFYRVVSYYPITIEEGIEIAKKFDSSVVAVEKLVKKFSNSENIEALNELNNVYEKAKEKAASREEKQKEYLRSYNITK